MISFRSLFVVGFSGITPCLLHGADPAPSAPASDPVINGAEVVKTKGEVTGLYVKNSAPLTAADYQQIRKLENLKTLSFGLGLDEASLKILAGMPALEAFTVNAPKVSDDGFATFASFPALTTLTIFHPEREFTGTGIAALATMPHLESFSLGGSQWFKDPALAAIATLPHLKSLRIWHTAMTVEGMKALLALKELKSLSFGQQVHGTLNDDAVAVFARLTSLESLTLSEARLSLPALSNLKQLPNLKNLTLTDIDITGGDIAALQKELPKVVIKWNAPKDWSKVEAIIGHAPTTNTPPPAPAK